MRLFLEKYNESRLPENRFSKLMNKIFTQIEYLLDAENNEIKLSTVSSKIAM